MLYLPGLPTNLSDGESDGTTYPWWVKGFLGSYCGSMGGCVIPAALQSMQIDKLPSVSKGNPSRCITDGKLTLLTHLAYVILSIMSIA